MSHPTLLKSSAPTRSRGPSSRAKSKHSTPSRGKSRASREGDDANHHLVANRGFWWVCCSINATPRTKEKLGYSLGTKCVDTARLRRDVFLNGLHAQGLEVRIRRHSSVVLNNVAMPAQVGVVPWQQRVEKVLLLARAAELCVDEPVDAAC